MQLMWVGGVGLPNKVTCPDGTAACSAKVDATEPTTALLDAREGLLAEAASWSVEECTGGNDERALLADQAIRSKAHFVGDGGDGQGATEHWQLLGDVAADNAAGFADFYGWGAGICSSDQPVTLTGDVMQEENVAERLDSAFQQANFTDFYGEQSLVCRGRVVDAEEELGRSVCSTGADGLSSESSVILSDGEDGGPQSSEETASLEAWTSTEAAPVSPEKLEEALEIAAQCAAAEEAGLGHWEDNIWDQLMALWPIVSFAAQAKFAPPPGFLDAMDTCAKSLLQAPENCLRNVEKMVELLESPTKEPVLCYLDCLEAGMAEAPRSSSVQQEQSLDCKTTALSQQRVQRTLAAWSTEHSLLQVSAGALWEVLMVHGPIHHNGNLEWASVLKARDAVQSQQEDICMQISKELEEAAARFGSKVGDSFSESVPELASNSRAALIELQELSGELLQRQRESSAQAHAEYEALNAKAEACRTIVSDARREVQRRTQSFSLVVQRFSKVARRLLSWKSTMVPKLRLLEMYQDDLKRAAELRQKMRALNKEYLSAGDDIDAAHVELRKCKRHTQGDAAVEAAQSHVSKAVEYARLLLERVQEVKISVQEAEDAIPMKIVVEEAEDTDDDACTGDVCTPRSDERLSPSLIELAQRASLQVAEAEAERDTALQQLAERERRDATITQVEADLMCPIMHERMREPVLAADGHTYERAAIERWMQSHDTSPMTGAPLTHRYLTQNFALRRIIAALDAGADPRDVHKECTEHAELFAEHGDACSE